MRRAILITNTDSDNVALLEIADLNSHDSRFTCRATNAAGSVQCSATMAVKGSSQLSFSRFKHSQISVFSVIDDESVGFCFPTEPPCVLKSLNL